MRARVKGTNDPFKEVDEVHLEGDYSRYPPDVLEFEEEGSSDTNWEELRIKTSIVAMQAIIPQNKGKYMLCDAHYKYPDTAREAVKYVDALIKKLKGK